MAALRPAWVAAMTARSRRFNGYETARTLGYAGQDAFRRAARWAAALHTSRPLSAGRNPAARARLVVGRLAGAARRPRGALPGRRRGPARSRPLGAARPGADGG